MASFDKCQVETRDRTRKIFSLINELNYNNREHIF